MPPRVARMKSPSLAVCNRHFCRIKSANHPAQRPCADWPPSVPSKATELIHDAITWADHCGLTFASDRLGLRAVIRRTGKESGSTARLVLSTSHWGQQAALNSNAFLADCTQWSPRRTHSQIGLVYDVDEESLNGRPARTSTSRIRGHFETCGVAGCGVGVQRGGFGAYA